jgi:hypothetical protein
MPPANSSSRRGRILPQSKADVEAALAAVRARTAKLKLQSPEGQQYNDEITKVNPRFNAAVPSTSLSSNERRQTSENARRSDNSKDKLDRSTLESVTKYISQLNGQGVPSDTKKATYVPTNDPDDDNSSSSSSANSSYNANDIKLQNISAMIEKIQNKKKTEVSKIVVSSSSSSDDSSYNENDIKLQNISAMIEKIKNKKKTEVTKIVVQASTSDSDSDSIPGNQNLDLINAMISKVHHGGPTAGKQVAPQIQSLASDISSDDSSVEAENVSAMTQANLALYIDSLNREKNQNMPDPIESIQASYVETKSQERSSLGTNLPMPAISLSPIPSKSNDNNNTSNRVMNPLVSKVKTYDDLKLQSYVEKAKEVAKKATPKIAEVEYIIIYARRDKIPIEPILRAFDVYDKTRENNISNLQLIQNGNNSTAKGAKEEQIDLQSTTLEQRNVHCFVSFLYEAISLVENSIMSSQTVSDLINRANDEKFDESLIREILNNPSKHIPYTKVVKTEMLEDSNSIQTLPNEVIKLHNADESQGRDTLIEFENDSDDSSMPVICETGRRSQMSSHDTLEASDHVSGSTENRSVTNKSRPTSAASSHSYQTESIGDLPRRNDSFGLDKDLDNNKKYLYLKIKQLDKAKQFARGSRGRVREVIHKDGSKSISNAQPPPLNSVKVTQKLRTRRMLKDYPSVVPCSHLQQWKIPVRERIAGHQNYMGVHSDSLHISLAFFESMAPIDNESWDERNVEQHFLRNSDLIKNANWLGKNILHFFVITISIFN